MAKKYSDFTLQVIQVARQRLIAASNVGPCECWTDEKVDAYISCGDVVFRDTGDCRAALFRSHLFWKHDKKTALWDHEPVFDIGISGSYIVYAKERSACGRRMYKGRLHNDTPVDENDPKTYEWWVHNVSSSSSLEAHKTLCQTCRVMM